MCGIFGLISENEIDNNVSKKMGDAISHRGPDDLGYYKSNNILLGNQRLAIIDLEGGNQPFLSENKDIIVVQNGEIFNFVELAEELESLNYKLKTKSDTEVILGLYEIFGIEFVKKLNGMFAIAIHDKKLEKTYIIRDRLGEKPMYYTKTNKDFLFASEIKSILSQDIKCQVNDDGIELFLKLGFCPPPLTCFENILQVLPGHYLEISANNDIQNIKWWSLENYSEKTNLSEDEALEKLNELLTDSIRIRMRSDVDYGAFLSGGIDSSIIVSKMAKLSEKVSTFTISFSETKFDEQNYASYVSDMFKTKKNVIDARKNILELWPKFIFHADQPHADLSFLPTYEVSQFAAKQVKMVLTGDGADELFAGYSKYLAYLNSNSTDGTAKYYKDTFEIFSKDELVTQGDSSSTLNEYFDTIESKYKNKSKLNQFLAMDCEILLAGNNLVKPDRMAMATSLEGRPPFMDHRLIEFAFQLPDSLKVKNNEPKYLLKKLMEKDFDHDFIYRDKQMFSVPVTEWDSCELDKVFTVLVDSNSILYKYLDKNFLDHLPKLYNSDKRKYLKKLRACISLELWFRIFIKKESINSLENLIVV